MSFAPTLNPSSLLITAKIKSPARSNETKWDKNWDCLRMHILAPRENGEANKEIQETLSDLLNISKFNIKFKSGLTSPIKRLEIICTAPCLILEKLKAL